MRSSLVVLSFAGIGLALLAGTVMQARPQGPSETAVAAATAGTRAPSGVAAEGRVVAYPGAEVTIGADAIALRSSSFSVCCWTPRNPRAPRRPPVARQRRIRFKLPGLAGHRGARVVRTVESEPVFDVVSGPNPNHQVGPVE